MRYLRYCTITLFFVLAGFTGACSVRAQDFSTVPDFPQDFTLVDPNAPSAGSTADTTTKSTTPATTTTPSSGSTTAVTAQPVTKTIPDTASGPESLKVITIAALLGFGVIAALRFHTLTSFYEGEGED
ncbi:hypothetical protein HY065_01935 [Candidatus Berkelbacteria bacterium]|nr:hypothetical protein [Candidatus Berkelbacteria bacterium]